MKKVVIKIITGMDTAWYSLEIGKFEKHPKDITPINELDCKEKEKIIQKYNNILNKRTI